jgi:hypothetical protein
MKSHQAVALYFLWERLSSRDSLSVDFLRLESRSHKSINGFRQG